MRRSFYSYIFLLFLCNSLEVMGRCNPLDLSTLLEGISCHDVAPKAMIQNLAKKKKDREETINRELGSSLVKSISLKLANMSDIDLTMASFGQKVKASGQSCSLQSLMESPPCELSKMNENIKKLSDNSYQDMNSFFDEISKSFIESNQLKLNNSIENCMSPAYRREYNISLFFEKYNHLDLKKFFVEMSGGELTDEYIELQENLKLLFWKDFDEDFQNLDTSNIEGNTLEEQMASLVSKRNNKEVLESRLNQNCQSIMKSIEGFLCSEIEEYVVNNPELNELIGYPIELLEDGFSYETLSDEGADIDSAFEGFIMNCPSKSEGTDELKNSSDSGAYSSIDALIDDHNLELYEIDSLARESEERKLNQSNISEKELQQMCSLMVCKDDQINTTDKQCAPRKRIRTSHDLDELLNCPGDDQCKTKSYQALVRTLKRTSSRLGDIDSGDELDLSSSTGLSSFAETFITKNTNDNVKSTTGKGRVTNAGSVQKQQSSLKGVTPKKKGFSRSIASKLDDHVFKKKQGPEVTDKKPETPDRGTVHSKNIHSIDRVTSVSDSAISDSDLRATFRSNNTNSSEEEQHKQIEAMYEQRRAMEEMLGAMKATNEKENGKSKPKNSSANLPGIARSNSYEERRVLGNNPERNYRGEGPSAQHLSSFMPSSNNTDRLGGNERVISDDAFEASPTRSVGTASSGATASSSEKARSVKSAQSALAAKSTSVPNSMGKGVSGATRVEDINSLLDDLAENSNGMSIEATESEIVKMTKDSLNKSGVKVDDPFIIILNSENKDYTVPVRSSLFRGRKILTPILTHKTASLTSLLRKSPIFKTYFRYQDQL